MFCAVRVVGKRRLAGHSPVLEYTWEHLIQEITTARESGNVWAVWRTQGKITKADALTLIETKPPLTVMVFPDYNGPPLRVDPAMYDTITP